MSVELEVEEIMPKDYSPELGTVKAVKDMGASVQITFWDGRVITPSKGTTMVIDQGGRFDRDPGT